MSVLLLPPENNVTVLNTPAFQDWAPNQISHYYFSNVVPALLIPSLVVFKMKDVIGLPETSQYNAFRLKAYQLYSIPTSNPWLMPLGSPGYPQDLFSSIPITANGMSFNFLPVFQNLATTQVGTYDYVHTFQIEGRLSSMEWQQISSFQHRTRLTMSNVLVDYSPTSLNYNHTQNTTLESQDITVNGANWQIVGRAYFELSSVTPGVVIATITPFSGEPYQTATGSGPAVVSVKLGAYFDTIGNFQEGVPLPSQLTILAGLTQVGIIPITVTVVNIGTLYADPQHLDFVAVKGIQEPIQNYIRAYSTEPPITITSSPWILTSQGQEVIDGILSAVIYIIPIPTANMSLGQYSGTVVLSATISGTISTITITIDYDLQGFVQSPYPVGKKAFTLDPLFYSFATAYLDTYFQITSVIETFDFFTNQMNQFTLPEKLPNFQGKAQLHFGKVIHRLMKRFPELNTQLYQYKPASFSMLVEEIDIATGDVVRSTQLTNQEFVAGLSRGIINDVGFLDFNQKPERVTPKSIYIFNVLTNDNSGYEIKIKQNGNVIVKKALGFSNGIILSKQFNFQGFIPGDVIEFDLQKIGNTTSYANKKFHVIPEQPYSYQLYWENEFLLQSVIEVTGSLTLKPDFEYKSNTLYQDLVEVLEYIETGKSCKLSVNTGWLINNSIDTITSLLRSPRAWIILNGKEVALRPIQKSMNEVDTERELVDFTLEFQINRKYDEETFTS